jgi:hypothetical protein
MDVGQVNRRLKEDKIPVKVLERGDRLYLQATLPNKPGESEGRRQRQIALGYPASAEGWREADFKARELARSLLHGTFSWQGWESKSGVAGVKGETTADLVQRFKLAYLAQNTLTADTWERHWRYYFDRLPQSEPLDAASLLAEVLLIEAGTWTRRQACLKYQKLADFAEIPINLKRYQGDYGRGKQKELEIPADKRISEVFGEIGNPQWRWVYGVMATFGLRDHEVFFCHFDRDSRGEVLLAVEEGKTGPRLVYPYYPDWVERWSLQVIQRPDIHWRSHKKYQDCGDRVGKAFKRQGVPWNPYVLRHAYAIRESVLFGLPVADAAKNMGHSPDVHLKTYNRWINAEHRGEVYQARKNLVLPPD